MNIKIDKGIPLPSKSKYDDLYPLKDMEVGDSFFIAVTDENKTNIRNRLSSAVRNYSRNKSILFSVRKVSGGIRVWRTQ